MPRETRLIEGFDQVRFRGPGDLKITQCDEESLTIYAPAYILQDIESVVVDGLLKLGYVSGLITSLKARREKISFDLKVRELSRFSLAGNGRVLIPDLDSDRVAITVSGSGEVFLQQLTADRFDVSISGSGGVRALGDVEVQNINISGSGKYEAEKLVSDFADIKLSGSGQAYLSVSDELSAVVSGSGLVTYSGYPEVYKQVTGSGKVVRKRKEGRNPTRGKEHA